MARRAKLIRPCHLPGRENKFSAGLVMIFTLVTCHSRAQKVQKNMFRSQGGASLDSISGALMPLSSNLVQSVNGFQSTVNNVAAIPNQFMGQMNTIAQMPQNFASSMSLSIPMPDMSSAIPAAGVTSAASGFLNAVDN